uniref:Uncharacterized protein n=1 Tax=Panagrolaimus sp. ES5 TaxID=591445 RepID=A0AC34FB94_9BILA
MFTIPPMTQLPGLPGFPTGPFVGVNPIPELPPIPESRLDGKYDNDGNFVPNSTPKPDKQILENRIHGVKIEPFKAAPNLFLHSQNDPPRSYANARGVEIVTVEPQHQQHQKPLRRANLHSSGSSEAQDEDEEVQPHRPQNARQWQTTATKLVNTQTAIEPPLLLSDKSIESIDKIIDEHGDKDHVGQSRRFQDSAEVVQPIGAGPTQKPPPSNRREIFTTKLLLGALGFQGDLATPQPLHPRRNNHRHRLPPAASSANVVKPQNRLVKPRRPAPPPPPQNPNRSQHFFDYKSKQQRTLQSEQKFVTKPPQIRSRIVPNRPQQQQQLRQPPPQKQHLPQQQSRQPLPVIIPILPPQPWNRDPQDAAFLHEVEEYDWRLHYKQQYLQQAAPTATQLRGYSRAQGEPQQPGNPHPNDYEDLIAIRNREYFTDNPPQKNLVLPGGASAAAPEASEVLIPFNNAQAQLSHTNFAQTGTRIASNNNNNNQGNLNGLPQIGGQPPSYFSPPVTQNPLFGGLFNLFNFNGQGQVR